MSAITPDIPYCPSCGLPNPTGQCPACALAAGASATPPPLPTRKTVPPHLTPPLPTNHPTRRSILETLLDPRTIHYLLASGGVLLFVGAIIWLASLGLFNNPTVVAAGLGAATAATLGAGWATLRHTRYTLAGRAITLLACLVMPLNLWFYHAHQLLTLDGHLWLAGLVCCALYAASAWVLEDALFVYVLSAGVAMTGLLMLADVHRFAEIAAPSTLLVVLGLICLHVERAFAPTAEDKPFSRQRFGLAFFWSAQALVGAGLLMLLGAQLCGWLYGPLLQRLFLAAPPEIVTNPALRWWALAIVAAGTYAYVYSDLVVRRVGTYMYVAAATLLWGEVLAIHQFHLSTTPAALIVAFTLTGVAANGAQHLLTRRAARLSSPKSAFTRPVPPLGLCLSLLPVIYGLFVYTTDVAGLRTSLGQTGSYVAAMFLAAAACRVDAHLFRKTMPKVAATYLFASAAATLVGSAALASVAGLTTWTLQAPVLTLIPIGYLIASRVHREDTPSSDALAIVAHLAAGLMLAATAVTAIAHEATFLFGHTLNLHLALVAGEGAIFYALAARFRGRVANVYAAAALAAVGVAQLLAYANLSTEYSTIAFAGLGVAMLLAHRLLTTPGAAPTSATRALAGCANALTSLALVAAALVALSRLAVGPVDHHVLPHAILGGLALAASFVGRPSGWRRWYNAMAITQGALCVILLQRSLHLTPWQHGEVFSVAIGLLLLLAGHIGWYREQQGGGPLADVSHNLLLGSLLAGVPLVIATLLHRFGGDISLANEAALMTVGLLCFVSGFLLRIRATTLTGGALLSVQLLVMLVSLGMRAQLAMGVYLTLGGGALFATGLLLSVYRDRLVTLPDRIKQREGVFKVLSWR